MLSAYATNCSVQIETCESEIKLGSKHVVNILMSWYKILLPGYNTSCRFVIKIHWFPVLAHCCVCVEGWSQVKFIYFTNNAIFPETLSCATSVVVDIQYLNEWCRMWNVYSIGVNHSFTFFISGAYDPSLWDTQTFIFLGLNQSNKSIHSCFVAGTNIFFRNNFYFYSKINILLFRNKKNIYFGKKKLLSLVW